MCSQTFPVSCRQTRMARHTFEPVRYYNSIGSHSPALTIAPGDTVATTTVDGRGFDAQDNQVTQSGNPMTGPFYIEGAEPGDTLVVSFDKLRPSRRRGWSFKMVWPTAVEPEYVRHLPWPDESDRLATWEVNAEASTVDPGASLGHQLGSARPANRADGGLLWRCSGARASSFHPNLLRPRWQYGLPWLLRGGDDLSARVCRGRSIPPGRWSRLARAGRDYGDRH